jgi:hypothetical protein
MNFVRFMDMSELAHKTKLLIARKIASAGFVYTMRGHKFNFLW